MDGTTSAYSYDNDYQVTQVMQNGVVSENYTYDAVGNRLTDKDSGYTYNLSNQLLSKTGTAFTYDNNGNMLTKTGANGTTRYAWDFENRLVQVVAPNADGTSSTISFQYDPFGRRIQKVGPNGTLSYIYDGANVRAQLDGNGFVITDYITGLGVDELLEAIPPGDNFYYETDRLGSVTSVSDAFVPATVLDTDTYTSFGATTDQNLTAGNSFRYTGREQDDETGLYYYRARYYDPTVGRFISEDPIAFNGGENFYRYAMNSPVDLSDPSGLCPSKPCAPAGYAPSPRQYQAQGYLLRASWPFGLGVGGLTNIGTLSLFKRGSILDAQVQYGGSQEYANYVFGVFMSAAGYSLSDALAGANLYGANFSHYPEGTQMDAKYPRIPRRMSGILFRDITIKRMELYAS